MYKLDQTDQSLLAKFVGADQIASAYRDNRGVTHCDGRQFLIINKEEVRELAKDWDQPEARQPGQPGDTAYIQLRTNKNGTSGYRLCQSVADTIRELGHQARVNRGPIATDPDTMEEAGDTVAHIVTTEAGKAAWKAWADKVRAEGTGA